MAFSWAQMAVGHEYAHVATLGVSSVALLALGLYGRTQLGSGEQALVPAGRLSVRGLLELSVGFISKLAHSVIGHHAGPYIPYFSAMFAIIFFNNIIGLIPGVSPATENANTTLSFGLFSFLVYNLVGLKHGGLHYLKHFLGPVWYLAPLMLIIEIISHFLRPVTLGLRLANVMKGDHTVISVFFSLTDYPFLYPIPFYVLGMLVSVIQAVVFTLLSMVYISLATSDNH